MNRDERHLLRHCVIAHFLLLNESIDGLMYIGHKVFQIVMESIPYGQHGKGDIIDQRRSHVAQRTGSELKQPGVVQVFSNQIVCSSWNVRQIQMLKLHTDKKNHLIQ